MLFIFWTCNFQLFNKTISPICVCVCQKLPVNPSFRPSSKGHIWICWKWEKHCIVQACGVICMKVHRSKKKKVDWLLAHFLCWVYNYFLSFFFYSVVTCQSSGRPELRFMEKECPLCSFQQVIRLCAMPVTQQWKIKVATETDTWNQITDWWKPLLHVVLGGNWDIHDVDRCSNSKDYR